MADSGTITYTNSNYAKDSNSHIKKLVMNWVSDAAAGTVEGTTADKFSGRLITAQFITGSVTPTDAYDVTVKDDQGQDILGGTGANITVATGKTSTAISSGLPFCAVKNTTLLLQIANAGNSKTGKVILFFE